MVLSAGGGGACTTHIILPHTDPFWVMAQLSQLTRNHVPVQHPFVKALS